MLLSYQAASWLVARRIPLLGVDYTSGSRAATLRACTGAATAGAAARGLSFEARWLDLPIVQSQQSLREFLAGSPANLIVKYRDTRSVTDRIRRLLRKRLGGEMPSLDEVGEALAVTPDAAPALARGRPRLPADQDELRRDAAIDFLLHTQLHLLDVANRVGFGCQHLHRAFKQWTGVAPGEYRLAHGPAEH